MPIPQGRPSHAQEPCPAGRLRHVIQRQQPEVGAADQRETQRLPLGGFDPAKLAQTEREVTLAGPHGEDHGRLTAGGGELDPPVREATHHRQGCRGAVGIDERKTFLPGTGSEQGRAIRRPHRAHRPALLVELEGETAARQDDLAGHERCPREEEREQATAHGRLGC